MAKRDILTQNKKKITPVSETEKKIFNYLKMKIGLPPVTQTRMAEDLNIPQYTISRRLASMIGIKKTYGKYHYTIVYENEKYKMVKEDAHAAIRQSSYTREQIREEHETRRELNIDELSRYRATENLSAIEITKTVILYPVKAKQRALVKKILQSLYTTDVFHDIVPCSKGVYIILKEISYLDNIRNDICKLYAEVVKRIQLDQESTQSLTAIEK